MESILQKYRLSRLSCPLNQLQSYWFSFQMLYICIDLAWFHTLLRFHNIVRFFLFFLITAFVLCPCLIKVLSLIRWLVIIISVLIMCRIIAEYLTSQYLHSFVYLRWTWFFLWSRSLKFNIRLFIVIIIFCFLEVWRLWWKKIWLVGLYGMVLEYILWTNWIVIWMFKYFFLSEILLLLVSS